MDVVKNTICINLISLGNYKFLKCMQYYPVLHVQYIGIKGVEFTVFCCVRMRCITFPITIFSSYFLSQGSTDLLGIKYQQFMSAFRLLLAKLIKK